MSRLIVISNRVSAPKARAGEATQGGLASALSAALRRSNGIWFGWSGNVTEQFSGEIAMATGGGLTVATIDLEEQDVEEYYTGYANQTLWPLLHHRVDLAEFDRHFGQGYERVNDRFADTVAAIIQRDDLVWVHDYHLIPLGQRLRRRDVTGPIGFFLHTPWPPQQLMISLPFHRRLLESMCAYDLIGFQSNEWHSNFLDYVRAELGLAVGADGSFDYDGRTIATGTFPISVDVAEITEMTSRPDAIIAYDTLKRIALGRKTIIGVDRLDYSKGIPERFLGYQYYLETHPEEARNSLLLQVAPLTRNDVASYADVRAELEGLSGHINGTFAHVDWLPIHYVNRSYPRDGLAGLFRAADVGLVTPLRDGMNLVAKEFVAAQDERDPGVLILSQFAGAAEQMTDALIVNPHSREELSEAIARAMAMPLQERQSRWSRLYAGLVNYDIDRWQNEFLSALRKSAAPPSAPAFLEDARPEHSH